MRTAITIMLTLFMICWVIISVRMWKKYSNLLEECADMYPLHFEEMCLWK